MRYRPRLSTCPDEYRSPLALIEMNVEEMRPLTYVGASWRAAWRGSDDSEGEDLSQGEWEEGDREMALEVLKAEARSVRGTLTRFLPPA